MEIKQIVSKAHISPAAIIRGMFNDNFVDANFSKYCMGEMDTEKISPSWFSLTQHTSLLSGCIQNLKTLALIADEKSDDLIVLGFNDTSTLEGHFVSSPREREKRDRRESRGDEREGQGRKRNRNESEETEEIKTFPLYPYPLQG